MSAKSVIWGHRTSRSRRASRSAVRTSLLQGECRRFESCLAHSFSAKSLRDFAGKSSRPANAKAGATDCSIPDRARLGTHWCPDRFLRETTTPQKPFHTVMIQCRVCSVCGAFVVEELFDNHVDLHVARSDAAPHLAGCEFVEILERGDVKKSSRPNFDYPEWRR